MENHLLCLLHVFPLQESTHSQQLHNWMKKSIPSKSSIFLPLAVAWAAYVPAMQEPWASKSVSNVVGLVFLSSNSVDGHLEAGICGESFDQASLFFLCTRTSTPKLSSHSVLSEMTAFQLQAFLWPYLPLIGIVQDSSRLILFAAFVVVFLLPLIFPL